MKQISDHISYEEATKSQTATRKGIENNPTMMDLDRMKLVAEKCFEPIRNYFKVPIAINSFYRSPKLNKAIGGSATSQHVTGEAIDMDAIDSTGLTNKQIFEWAKANLDFDQIIAEGWNSSTKDFEWVHISYKKTGNRKQVLTAIKNGNKTIYK